MPEQFSPQSSDLETEVVGDKPTITTLRLVLTNASVRRTEMATLLA